MLWKHDIEEITLALLKTVLESLNIAFFYMLMVIFSLYRLCFTSLVSPKITPFTFGQPKHFGAMVSVQCILGEGDLPVKIQWKFNENLIESDYGIMISALGARVSNMMIESVEGRHAGNYTCSAQNRAGIKSFTAELEIIGTFWINSWIFLFPLSSFSKVPPRISPFTFGDEPSSFGDTISVQCTISGGDAPFKILWMLNDMTIVDTHNNILLDKRGERVHTLFIESVKASHIGNYTCVATNRAGSVKHSSQLLVNGS